MTVVNVPLTLNAGQWQNYASGYAGLTIKKNSDKLCLLSGFVKPATGGSGLTANTPVTVASLDGASGEVSATVLGSCTIAYSSGGVVVYVTGLAELTYEDDIVVQSPVTCTPIWVGLNLSYYSTD